MGVRNVVWPPSGVRICDPRCQENETPARVSSGRNSSMIKGYVNGGSFVKRFFDVESMPSGRLGEGGFLEWLPRSLDSSGWIPWIPTGIHLSLSAGCASP
jgi:hypothetical protein